MAFRKDSAILVRKSDRERAAILESKHERRTNEADDVLIGRQVDGTLDTMKPWDRKSVSR